MEPGRIERLLTQRVKDVMLLYPYFCRLFLIAILVTLSGLGGWETILRAAPPSSKPGAKSPLAQPLVLDRKVSPAPPTGSAKLPSKSESNKTVATGSQGQVPSPRARRKTSRHRKAGKKWHPPAVVQPKPDLSYHGMFEQPQRYDPSRDRRTGRALNPQASELQHDHFQELDKNYDGMIDPFERAFGRLDMDRDVSNRQWE